MEARKRNYNYFVGTDISKRKLDHAVVHEGKVLFHKVTANTPNGVMELIEDLLDIPGFRMNRAMFCMEQTGIYCNYLLSTLSSHQAAVILESAAKIRNSLGIVRNKNDKIDAIRIAHYASQNRDKLGLWMPKRQVLQYLAHVTSLRRRLVGLQTAIKKPIKEQRQFFKQSDHRRLSSLCNTTVEAVKHDIEVIDATIHTAIEKDEHLSHLMHIITSIPGIGPLTGLQILICTNEFKDIHDPKKFACYAGVAPFINESGKYRGKAKVSHIANKRMKALLHLSAMCSIRYIPEIKAYFERRTKVDGKPKMSVVNAIRYKIILRVFACVSQDRCYESVYDRNVRPSVGQPC